MPDERRFLLTRQELFDQVWAAPMTKIAKRYGISDVALAKWCKKLRIPRPTRGYWAKAAAGHRVVRAKLPPAIDVADGLIVTDPSTLPPRPVAPKLDIPIMAQPVAVPLEPTDLHPLVERTRRALEVARRRQAVGSTKILSPITDSEHPCLSVHVTDGLVGRAIAVLDAVCKELERRGFEISADSHASLGSQSMPFMLCEDLDRTPYEPTRKERIEAEKYPYSHKLPKWNRVPKGTLALQCRMSGDDPWRIARETPRCTTEEMVGKFVRSLYELAARAKARREERERIQRQYAEEDRRRREEAERQRVAQARYDELMRELDAWRTARDIEAYVASVRGVAEAKGVPLTDATELGKWIAWALRVAALTHPAEGRVSPKG